MPSKVTVGKTKKISQTLKWYGGKSYLASWILSHFPSRDRYTHYCEPYAGGLSVLFAHDPTGKAEAVNDIHRGLTTFWDMLAHRPDDLIRILSVTPLSEPGWREACMMTATSRTELELAVSFFIKFRQSRQGLGKDYTTNTKRTRRGMNEQVSAWLSAVEGLPESHQRLRTVEVRNMDAVRFIKMYDHDNVVYYCDPSYLHETRVTTKDYEHEMTTADHEWLLDSLSRIKGKFLLSGYDSELYRNFAANAGWRSVSRVIDNKASSKKVKDERTEFLWMNY